MDIAECCYCDQPVVNQERPFQAPDGWFCAEHLTEQHLISAAKDLLEAAKEIMAYMPLWHPVAFDVPTCPGCIAVRRLEAAIAKAEGKD